MATSGLYGSSPTGVTVAAPGSETSGLYGNGTTFGGTYFEWFIFIQSATQPATPTGGSWSFTTNTGTPPVGWSSTPPSAPTLPVWGSIALVNSANSASLTWSAPGLFAYAQGLPVLSGADIPLSGDGVNSQLYIQTGSTPQTIWFKESGTWTRLTGSTLYVDLVNNQTIGGTKTFSSQIQGSISGTSSNVTGVVAIANGGTGQATATNAINALLPSQTGNTGKYLTTDGSNTSWQPTTGAGTVTSVDVSGGTTGLTTSGGPITAAGTITLAGTLAVANGGTGATTAGGALTNLGAIGAITSADASIVVTQVGSSVDLSVSTTSPASVLLEQVRNTTGATLAKGTAVYISGATGQIPTVSKALATSDATSAQTLGLITSDLPNNSNGYVTIIGLVTNLNTSAYTDGQQLYLSPTTAGTLTGTKPYAPQHLVYMAVVAHAHPTQGKLVVKVQNGYELDELHNVSAQSPTTGQTIVWNSATNLWEKNTVSLTVGVNGTLPVANGGTGQTTANAAFNALAPSQTGNTGKYLTTDGTNTSWATNPLGTVTSVAASVPAFLSITGSPITTSGTLAFGLSGTALPTTSGGTGLTSFTANGVVYASSTSALTTGSALTFDGSKLVNTGYNKSTYQVSTNNVGTFESVGAAYLSYDSVSGANIYSRSDASTESTLNFRASTFSFKIGGTQVSSLDSSSFSLYNTPILLSGSTSGYTGFAAPATSNFTIYTLPSSDGTANQALVTNGSGTLSWASTATGTVTSVAASVPSFLSISGSPITSSGTLAITLSGTALPTTSGGTGLTSFTANGVVYASSSSALATGSALTWNGSTLLVGGNTRFGSGAVIPGFATASDASLANNASLRGTNAAGSTAFELIKFNTSDQVVINNDGADAVITTAATFQRWNVGGGEQMRLTSTGLGIGTSSPASALDVKAANAGQGIRLTSTTGTNGVSYKASNSAGNVYFGIDTSTGGTFGNANNAVIWYDAAYPLIFATNNSKQMTLDSSGNLGLGVTPSAWAGGFKGFDILYGAFTSNANASTRMYSAGYYGSLGDTYSVTGKGAGLYVIESSAHKWYNAPSGTAGNAITFTQAMTLDASGQLLLGTTTNRLGEKLHVLGNGIVTSSAENTNMGLFGTFGSSNLIIGAFSNLPVEFRQNNTERMRIDSSGNFLIGDTAQAFGEKFNVTAGAQNGVLLKNTAQGSNVGLIWNASTTGDAQFFAFATETSYTGRGSISYNRAGGLVAYNVASDYRAKDIYGPVTGSGALIDSTPVYMGKMHGATQERPMFIAHETPAYAHTGVKDAVDEDGNPVYQQMDASALIPVMWAEIQSLRKRLADAGI